MAPQGDSAPPAQSPPPRSPAHDGAHDGQDGGSSGGAHADDKQGGSSGGAHADDGQDSGSHSGDALPDDGQGGGSNSNSGDAQGGARVGAGSGTSDQPAPLAFPIPRRISARDVDALLLHGLSSAGEPSFKLPDGSPNWALPANPESGNPALVVGVPATVEDMRDGAHIVDGYGGPATLVGLQTLSADDTQFLRELYPEFSDAGALQPRDTPLTRHALDVALDSIEVRRECASILTHFTRDNLARRVFETSGLLQRMVSDLRRLKTLVASEGSAAVVDAARAWQESDDLERFNVLEREWAFNVAYWHTSVSKALSEIDSIKAHYQAEIQTQKGWYQDQIDALEADKARLKTRLADTQTQGLILESRLNAAVTDPWKLTEFLRRNASISGSWDRLHELVVHWVQKTQPPSTWDTMITVTCVDDRHAVIPDYVEAYEAALSSGLTTVNSPGRKTPPVLDLTGSGSNSRTSGNSHPQTPRSSRAILLESKRPAPKGSATAKSAKQHKVQRRPTHHTPGRDGVRSAGEPPSVPKEDACASLPGAVVWKPIRPDHRQAMLGGFTYHGALDRILDDHELHGFFRQPQLIKMLVSMMYRRRLDSTPWAKYVHEAYYKMADERLDLILARGDVPPPWEGPHDHIAYPDEDVESTADDEKADSDFEPPTNEMYSSSEDEGDSVTVVGPPTTKPASKRSRGSSDEDSDADEAALVASSGNRKQHKSNSGSRRPSATRRNSGQSQTPRGTRHYKSILASKDYQDPTVQELRMIETPDDDELSWVYCGVKVQRLSVTKSSPTVQSPGFPNYEPHKRSSRQVKARWIVALYISLLEKKPWESMYRRRIRVLYFHRRSDLNAATLKMLERLANAMFKLARALWECGHWVTIDTEADKASAKEYNERVSRRNAALREYEGVLARAFNNSGFPQTMKYEPGIWTVPARCCHWIWQDPRVKALGGPACDSLEDQLAAVDALESARIQWRGGCAESEWLQFVPTHLQTSERMLSKEERKRNPISIKDMRSTLRS